MSAPIPSDGFPMLNNSADAARLFASDRTVFMHNRLMTDNPVCTIVQKTFTHVDPLRGTSVMVPVTLFADHPCDHDHVTEKQIAQGGGLVQAEDRVVYIYGLGGILDARTTFLHLDDHVWYRIILQKFQEDANYTMLHVRALTIKGAALP